MFLFSLLEKTNSYVRSYKQETGSITIKIREKEEEKKFVPRFAGGEREKTKQRKKERKKIYF